MKPRSSKNESSQQLDVPLRHQKQQRDQLNKQQHKQAASSPRTTAADLRPRKNRFRAVSDGVVAERQLSQSPTYGGNPSLSPSPPLPVVGEDSAVMSILQPPPSPSTPPKKVWEQKFGSFLRNPLRGARAPQAPPTLPLRQTVEPLSPSKEPKASSRDNSEEGSVRGGKFFSGVFRSTSDGGKNNTGQQQHRKVKSFSHASDELDGTLRRGTEKAYSPGSLNSRAIVDRSATWNNANSVSHGSLLSQTNARTNPASGQAVVSTQIRRAEDGMPTPPLFIAPSSHRAEMLSGKKATNSSSSSSSAMKKAFTDFHNSSHNTNSAYLGDDPSFKGNNLFWAQKNQHLERKSEGDGTLKSFHSHGNIAQAAVAAAALSTAGSHSPYSSSSSGGSHHTNLLHEAVKIAKSQRILKLVAGVEAWQTGRRYLIAPAVLAACPVTAVSALFGNSSPGIQSPEQAASAIQKGVENPFATIVLGECLLSYVHDRLQQTHMAKQWSSAKLVLRQNYLLEYDSYADILHGVPRGFAHLQLAKTVMHEHFDDALELHFYGSPCAKADARVLMIRIIKTWQHENDSSQRNHDDLDRSRRSTIREQWKMCLNRAASLTKVSDLYEYDETASSLGNSQYAEVRAARRRLPEGRSASSGNDCALKIFNKNKFWRMVVKGRERADTLVRETAVQATLTAKCGDVPSFLRVRGFFETSDNVVLELELLEGTDLFRYISSKTVLSEPEAAMILRDILLCLGAMNRLGLSHRDIKPANILMCTDFEQDIHKDRTGSSACRVKVGDFGMATFVDVDGQLRGRCGTPGYVAPDIFTSGIYGGYSNKVDIFSAGVTLYVMLCGYEPFYGETDDELVRANKMAIVEFPAEDWSGVSEQAKDLVKQMMQADPAKRIDARRALQHPWIVTHLDEPEELNRSVSNPIDETPRTDDACIVS